MLHTFPCREESSESQWRLYCANCENRLRRPKRSRRGESPSLMPQALRRLHGGPGGVGCSEADVKEANIDYLSDEEQRQRSKKPRPERPVRRQRRATAKVPAVYTRAVGGGRVHHTAGKGVEDAKVRDHASGLTAATEPSDRLLARSVGGGGGARSARSTQRSSCCPCSRRRRELRPSAHRHPSRNRHYLPQPQRQGAQVLQ